MNARSEAHFLATDAPRLRSEPFVVKPGACDSLIHNEDVPEVR